MKYLNIYKLLSVLLCIVMLFTACAAPADNGAEQTTTESATETETVTETETEAPTETETEEALLEDVAPEFKNFFDAIAKEEESELVEAVRIEGDVVGSDNEGYFYLLLFKDIDAKNNVTEEYKLYNIVSGEIELTFSNTYFNGAHSEFDWNNLMIKSADVAVNGEVNYRESYLNVFISEIDGIPYLVARRATVTEIDETVIEENPDGCIYEIATAYEYYDMYGNLITKSNGALDVELASYEKGSRIVAKFGAVLAYFDTETYELVSAGGNYDTDKISGVFTVENNKYGYFLDCSTSIAGLGNVRFIEIIDKASGNLAYCYYLNDNYMAADAFVLHNGDVLIQYINLVEDGVHFNCYDADADEYYEIAHEIFSVKDGKATAVELGYCIVDIADGEKFCAEYDINESGFYATENARNIAYVCPFDKESIGDLTIAVFDNDMSLLYEFEKIVPEHLIDIENGLGIELLPNGDYLVDLDGVVVDKAIVKADGTVRTYIPANMTVIGNFIFDGQNAYDYDLNFAFPLEQNNYELYGCIYGEFVIIEKDAFIESSYTRYLKVGYTKETDSGYSVYFIDYYCDIRIVETADDYMIIQREEDDKYVLLNEYQSEVLVTYNPMKVYSFNGGYIAVTSVNGQTVLYEIN